ncbi:MAG: RtcB family protein [Candidatus Marinimicrobia bacterium]|nr:RtcB family protein [Candidatus Neomarinimicrobiota bacterium]
MERVINKVNQNIWEIPQTGKMRVPGRIFASEDLMQILRNDASLDQIVNVAQLPGITGFSFGMPDIHWGYGFPIGGVAATDIETGVISPGGVGYDINCGVRLIRTNLHFDEMKNKIKPLIATIFGAVPSGIGSHNAIKKLNLSDIQKILMTGAQWAVENRFGTENDLNFIEDRGCLQGADPDIISKRAIERGLSQMGTLGSGNHFIEISKVADIYDDIAAQAMDISIGNIVIQIHTGSRGLGYQVCDDFIKVTLQASRKYGIEIPDRQLSCAPLTSPEGKDYLAAMRASANFAFSNRQVIHSLIEHAFIQSLNISPSELGFRCVWDIAHNIAKIEEHDYKGIKRKYCVHRKGATRAFGPDYPELPLNYKSIGQPVLIPGDMGTESYVCIGTKKAMAETFGSSCHGAGRILSRSQAKKKGANINHFKELEKSGVFVMAEEKSTIAEEMPFAYKDVTQVVNTLYETGIIRKVARLVPWGVVKG